MKRKMGDILRKMKEKACGIQEYTRKSVVNEEGVTMFLLLYVISDWLMRV